MSHDPMDDSGTDSKHTKLDDLLRESLPAEDPAFARPSASVIDAYLLGTVSDQEREQVLLALARSCSFRKEILEASLELDDLQDSMVRTAFDEAGENHSPREPETRRFSVFERIRTAIWRPQIAYLIALVALLVPLTLRHDGEPKGQLGGTGWSKGVGSSLVPAPEVVVLGENETRATFSADAKTSLLVFLLPVGSEMAATPGSFKIELRDAQEKSIAEAWWPSEKVRNGFAALPVAASLVKPGQDYILLGLFAPSGVRGAAERFGRWELHRSE